MTTFHMVYRAKNTPIISGEKVREYLRPQIGGGVAAGYGPNQFQEGKAPSQCVIALWCEGQPVNFPKVWN